MALGWPRFMVSHTVYGKVLAVLLAILGVGRLGIGIVFWRAANKLERPSFTVLNKIRGGTELRKYEQYLIAETEIAGGAGIKDETGSGFRVVAGYIFGKNKPKTSMAMTAPVRVSSEKAKGEKMAMTAPVRSESSSGSSKTKVSFVLGSKYTKSSAPAPMDRSVKVRSVLPHILAARTFSGPPPSERRIEKERTKIVQALAERGMRPADTEVLVYGYHDPFITPSFLRRNEVCVRVAGAGP